MGRTMIRRRHAAAIPKTVGAAPAVLLILALALATVVQAAPTRLRPVRQQEPDAVTAPPINDLCSGALTIPGDGPFPNYTTPVNVFEAGTAGDPPRPPITPAITLLRSAWYTFTPAQDGRYVFSACTNFDTATTLNDSLMAAYTSAGGCSGPFTHVANADQGCTFTTQGSELSLDLAAGTTYYIVIWSSLNHPQNASQANVQIRTTRETSPPETCDVAFPLLLNVPTNGTNLNTRNDYELAAGGACFPSPQVPTTAPGSDVVYSFTAPTAGNYAFRLINKTSAFVDYVLYLSSSCPSPDKEGPVVVDCFAAARTGQFTGGEISCVTLAAGQQVYFFVDSPTTTGIFQSGNFGVVVERCESLESEANDTPATADPLGCGVIGSLGPTITDRDFYAFGTPSSDVRLYALVDASTSMPENDFDLRVNTTTHTLEFDHRDNGIGPNGGLAPNVAGTRIPAGTTTFLQVDIRQSQGGGTAVETGGPYRLYAVAQNHADSVAEAEPNDTINTSNAAASNYFTGQLTTGDADHFAFRANAGDVLFLSMDGCPDRGPAGIFAELQLLSETGTRLALTRSGSDQVFFVPPINSLFAFGPNWRSAAMVVRAPYTGFYVARISHLQNTPTGPYALSIAKNCEVGGGGVTPCTLSCVSQTVTATTDPGQCTAVVNLPIPSTDGFCGVVSCSPPSGSAFPLGTTVVECAGAGASSCPITVVVTDDEAPAVNCPTGVAATITGPGCSVAVDYNVTASDNCAGSGVTCSPASGSSFGPGTTIVTCTATDSAGNQTACAFPVVVTDATAPTIACPADLSVAASQALGCSLAATVNFATPAVSDNCAGASVVCAPASGSVFPVGSTTVNCTASDAAGNTATCAFTVTVGTPGSVCFRDDASGDTFTQVVDSTSPLYGFWRYRKANGTTFCGLAESVSFTPGVRLVSSDRNDPVYRMECNANFGATTSTVQVTELATNRRHTLRDRNVNNNPPCP